MSVAYDLARLAVLLPVLFSFDVAPVVASSAALLSALLAGATWLGARITSRRTRDVDTIRVSQEALVGTIGQLQQRAERAEVRAEHAEQQAREIAAENDVLRARVAQLEWQMRECRERLQRLMRD